MKNLMVMNVQDNKRYEFRNAEVLLKAQIENSIELGWKPEDIVVLANVDYEFMNIKTINCKLNDSCLTGSKMFGLKWYFENNKDSVVWAHDLDCWQNWPFTEPEFKDVGIAQYSNNKYNGGSLFWRLSAKDIIDTILNTIIKDNLEREEPTLNRVLKSKEIKDRVTVLNNTFNVGCSGFVKRYNRSLKPIRVCHFHPYNRIAWETHALDRNKITEVPITVRLERLMRKYYPSLATVKK